MVVVFHYVDADQRPDPDVSTNCCVESEQAPIIVAQPSSCTEAILENLTFEQLQTFQAIVRSGTFSRAAQELFLTQPAISQRVYNLEQTLGVDLFLRQGNRRTLRLTAAGERLLQFAYSATALAHQFRFDTNKLAGSSPTETIAIAASLVHAKYLLPCLLVEYYKQCPDTRVDYVHITGIATLETVREGRVDLGVSSEYYDLRGLASIRLVRDRLVLIAPPDHPVLDDAACWLQANPDCPFIAGSPYALHSQFVRRWAASLGLAYRVAVQCSISDVAKELVVQGLGLAIVSELAVANDLRWGRLKIVDAPNLPIEWPFCVVYNPERPLSPSTQTFLRVAGNGTWRTRLPL